MKIKRKKMSKALNVFAAAIASTMIVQNFASGVTINVFAKSEKAETTETTSTYSGFSWDFETETGNLGFDIETTKDAIKQGRGKSGKGAVLSMGHHSKIFDFPVDSGVYRLSFDIKGEDGLELYTGAFSYDQDKKSEEVNDALIHKGVAIKDGKMTYYVMHEAIRKPGTGGKGAKSEILSEKQKNFDLYKWNHIDVYYDFDNSFTYTYLNNELLGREKLGPMIKKMYGIDVSVKAGSCTLDNYAFEKLDYSGQKAIKYGGGAIPDELVAPMEVEFEEITFANNYWGEKADISMKMTNDTGADHEFNVTYRTVDDMGFELDLQTDIVSIKAGETVERKITVTPGKYGLYTLQLTATAEGVDYPTTKKLMFTLIKQPPDGLVNEKMMTQDNTNNDTDNTDIISFIEPVYDMFEKAGYWGIRGGSGRTGIKNYATWNASIPLEFSDRVGEMLNYSRTHRMTTMFTYTGSKVMWDHVPVGEEELADFYDYCYYTALKTKDFIEYYEMWNEPNASSFNVNATAEQVGEATIVAAKAMKAANPNAKMVGIALTGCSKGELEYMDRILAVAADYIDYITIHPYMWMQTPEDFDLVGQVQYCHEIMAKYGFDKDKLWFGEVGVYSHVGFENMARYTAQMYLLNDEYELASKIVNFRYTDDDSLPREGFGFLNGSIDNQPFLARKNFLMSTAYNCLMTDSKPAGIIDYDDTQKLYRYKLADGRDALVFWNNDEWREIAVDLGVDSVEAYDIVGNKRDVYGIDGKYQFSIDGEPVFVVGNFEKVEKCDEFFKFDKDLFEVVQGDKTDITLQNFSGKDFNIKFEQTDEVVMQEDAAVGGGDTTFHVEFGDISKNKAFVEQEGQSMRSSSSVEDSYNDYGNAVRINVYNGDKLFYTKLVKVECINTVDITHFAQYYINGRWQYVADVTNNMYDKTISGAFEILAPAEYAKYVPRWDFGEIKAGETKRVLFPVPDRLDEKDLNFDAKVIISDGYTTHIYNDLNFRSVTVRKNAPTIDGVIEPGEYDDNYVISMDANNKDGGYFTLLDTEFGGDNDCSAKVYVEFDEKNIYFAATVKDDVQMDHPDRGVWAGDSFQLDFALERKTGAPYTEVNIGLVNGKPTLTRSSDLIAGIIANDIPHQLEIVRNEDTKTTVYEMSMPLNEIYPASFELKKQATVAFSLVYNDRDKDKVNNSNEGRDGFMEYGSGIARGGKNPSLYLNFNLAR